MVLVARLIIFEGGGVFEFHELDADEIFGFEFAAFEGFGGVDQEGGGMFIALYL